MTLILNVSKLKKKEKKEKKKKFNIFLLDHNIKTPLMLVNDDQAPEIDPIGHRQIKMQSAWPHIYGVIYQIKPNIVREGVYALYGTRDKLSRVYK